MLQFCMYEYVWTSSKCQHLLSSQYGKDMGIGHVSNFSSSEDINPDSRNVTPCLKFDALSNGVKLMTKLLQEMLYFSILRRKSLNF